VLAWLADLSRLKQQPNLVFAAARWHGAAAPAPYDELRRVLLEHEAEVKETIRTRRTQTNEVGRLATLVPVFGLLDGPLALIEVGASAGLCLYPDRYDYRWPGAGELTGSGGPTLIAAATAALPVPDTHPDVRLRSGVDLHPLEVGDADAIAWLENLVWPEQEERRRRLLVAVETARAEPPEIVRGDLLSELDGLVDRATDHGTPVVFHSAVIAYLDRGDRMRFAALMSELVAAGRCRWVSNEAPGIVPGIGPGSGAPAGRFALALDGRQVAWTHGHGHAIEWICGRSADCR
jgi:hypothetical protein